MKNPASAILDWLARRILARYEGATTSTRRSVLHAGIQSARFDANAATRLEFIRKSRYFERNNALLNRLADLFEQYASPQPAVNPSTEDTEWNKRAADFWNRWSELPDVNTRQPLSVLSSLWTRSWFIDGESFINLVRHDRLPRIQLIESHLVATPPDQSSRERKDIIDGIKIDATGRPTAYYIASEDEFGQKLFPPPIPADFIIHVYEPSRPGQYRGLPFIYPVVNDLHDLDDLQILEMLAAKDAAEPTNVIKNAVGELSPEELRRRRFIKGQITASDDSITEQKLEYYQDRIGGRTVVMQRDDDIQQFPGQRPSERTQAYWKYLAGKVCNGVGIPLCLAYPESIQGTVYRGILDTAAGFFQSRWLVGAAALLRIYRHVIGWARYNEPTLRDAPADWMKATLHPPRAVNVDVGRNSAAMLAELEAGATTYEAVYAPLGLDWRERFRQIQLERAYARELNIELGKPTPQPPPTASPAAPDKEEDNEDELAKDNLE